MQGQPFTPDRAFLVFVRAGDDSLHARWLAGDPSRNWDCLVSYYGQGTTSNVPGDGVVAGGFGKLDSFKALYERYPDFFSKYAFVLVTDPDLEVEDGDLSRLFRIAKRYSLDVSQAALTHDSFWSHFHTLQHPRYLWRKTNFVEVMCPMFSREALRELMPWFDLNKSTWGIDLCWAQAAGKRFSMAIIDAVAVRHAKKIDLKEGAWYAKLRSAGSDPWMDLAHAQRASGPGARWLRPRSFLSASVQRPGVGKWWAFIATRIATAPACARQLFRWSRARIVGLPRSVET